MITPDPSALPIGAPTADAIGQPAAASSGAPDAALIARMANAFFAAVPANPGTSPGAAMPSAPLFAAEPAARAVPGVPAASFPLLPNGNPGLSALPFPSSGAAGPSAPLFAANRDVSQLRPASPAPLDLALPSAPMPPHAAPIQSAAAAVPAAPPDYASSDHAPLDYAVLPNRLDRSDLVFDARLLSGLTQPDLPAPALPANPAWTAPAAPATTPFLASVTELNLGGLAVQHQPTLSGLTPSGTPAFEPHVAKRDFPILQQQVNGRPLVWLDNGATTQKPRAVIDRLVHFYEHENSNIHRAAHTLAARATDAYEAARDKVRAFINAPSVDDIIFVRGATEGINLIAQAWGRRNIGEGDEIVITHLEHHANIVPWQQLAAEKGARLRVAPVDETGQILLEDYEKLFTPRTRIAAIAQVSNALGTITPIREMTAIAHRHGAKVLIDGAQGICHMPVDVQQIDCDFYIFSGHKMFGPTGIGVVYGNARELEAMPPWQGGGNMIADVTFERTVFQGPPARFEAGTGNIADAVGLGAAIDYLTRIGMNTIAAHEHALLAYATQGLCSIRGLRLIGTAKEKAGVLSFVLDGCRSEDVGKALDQEGIAVRAGHHCAQPILRRFGLESTVRASLALYNTTEDIDALVAALQRIQSRHASRLA